jgi:hypothetical protein
MGLIEERTGGPYGVSMYKRRKKFTAGRVACLGVIIALVGNELTEGWVREAFEIGAIIIAVLGLMLE